MHGQYCYNMYVQAWYIPRITRECPTDYLLTTHAHTIREEFVGADNLGHCYPVQLCVVSASYVPLY